MAPNAIAIAAPAVAVAFVVPACRRMRMLAPAASPSP
jgi:hypothetical protein